MAVTKREDTAKVNKVSFSTHLSFGELTASQKTIVSCIVPSNGGCLMANETA